MASLEFSYSRARQHLARLLDRVTSEREVAIITRRNKEDVVLLPRDEFEGLMETVHLLRSPANRRRLFAAMEAAERGEGQVVELSDLTASLGLDEGAQSESSSEDDA